MYITSLDLLLWAMGFIELVALQFVLISRGRYRRFPIFFALITLNVLRTIALYAIRRFDSRHLYFKTYWTLAVIDGLLQLGLVYELSAKIFRPVGSWAHDVRTRLALWIGVSVLVALLLSLIPNPPHKLWIQVPILKGGFFSAALISELCVGMIVLSVTASLTWSPHVTALVKGFAIYSIVTVGVETLNTAIGLKEKGPLYDTLTHLRIVTWQLCVVYWTITIHRDHPPTKKMPDEVRQQVALIRKILSKRLEKFRLEEGL